MIHPITFSIPAEKLVNVKPVKTKIISDLIPGKLSTYIYTTEEEYYKEYQQSYFAITTKKGGWDCMRHYEILANRCIPYFPNIELCPPNTISLIPKELIKRGNTLYNTVFASKTLSTLTPDEIAQYDQLQEEMFEYTKQHLTTKHLAQYILRKTQIPNAPRILYLSGNTSPDYLRCVTLHGFKQLLGSACHDYPMVPHIYKTTTINYANLYGRGMTYTNLLDASLHDYTQDACVEEAIKNKEYDIIIYGSYHRGMPLYSLVIQNYPPNKVILMCGEDIHKCDNKEWIRKGHTVFVREL